MRRALLVLAWIWRENAPRPAVSHNGPRDAPSSVFSVSDRLGIGAGKSGFSPSIIARWCPLSKAPDGKPDRFERNFPCFFRILGRLLHFLTGSFNAPSRIFQSWKFQRIPSAQRFSGFFLLDFSILKTGYQTKNWLPNESPVPQWFPPDW